MYHEILGESTHVEAPNNTYECWYFKGLLITYAIESKLWRVSTIGHPFQFYTRTSLSEIFEVIEKRFATVI